MFVVIFECGEDEFLGGFREVGLDEEGEKPPRGRCTLPRYDRRSSFYANFAELVAECEIHNRAKDVGSATAEWFKELLSSNPWFAKVVPNVSTRDVHHAFVIYDTNCLI